MIRNVIMNVLLPAIVIFITDNLYCPGFGSLILSPKILYGNEYDGKMAPSFTKNNVLFFHLSFLLLLIPSVFFRRYHICIFPYHQHHVSVQYNTRIQYFIQEMKTKVTKYLWKGDI